MSRASARAPALGYPWRHSSSAARAAPAIRPNGDDQTVLFYRDMIGLPVLETFHDSYGLDGTILGLPGGAVHLEIVQLGEAPDLAHGLDQLVFYLRDAAAQERIMARLAAAGVHPVAEIDYWQDTTAALPTKTLTDGKWCSRPGSTARRESANLTWAHLVG